MAVCCKRHSSKPTFILCYLITCTAKKILHLKGPLTAELNKDKVFSELCYIIKLTQ